MSIRSVKAFALVCASLIALAGCASVPLPTLPVETPAAWRQQARATGARAPDLRGWWKAFEDPQLDRLVDAALADNLTIRQAALRIDASRALAGTANAAFQPQLSAHTFSEPAPDSSASYFQMGFDARWELGLFGRAQSRARVTAGDLGIAESDLQSARVSVIAEVVRSYIEFRGARLRLALFEQVAATANEKSTLVATRQRLRLASARELALTQAEAATAEAALVEPRLAIDNARRRIGVLLARSEDAAGFIDDDAPMRGRSEDIDSVGVDSMPADLLRTRPEIHRAENEVLKTAGELGLARADLYPRLGLGGALTYASKVIGHTRLSDADGIITFGPAIEIPLFDWGARRAIVTARDAELSASLLAYRQAVLEGVAEAQTALTTLERQRERLAALQRARESLERSDVSSETLHRLGLADSIELATSRSTLLQARIEIVQAQQQCDIAFVALYKALGGAPLPDTTMANRDARTDAHGE
ncbi:MAG: efflux transporter outer membrane subunit [Dokdonella sp.]